MKISQVLIIWLISSFIIFAQSPTTVKNFQNDDDKVVWLTYDSQFDKAFDLCNERLAVEPNSLKWKYFHAMVYFRQGLFQGSYILSLEGTDNKAHAESLLDKSFNELQDIVKSGDAQIQKNPNDTLALFFTGAAYGYIGMLYANKDENFTAASQGKKGIDYHEKLIGLCPHWNDVYYSRAIFNFYTSMVPWYLKPILWILGNLGNESDAELYLKKVYNWGHYAKYDAMEKLRDLYRRQEKYNDEFAITLKLSEEFPENRFMYLLYHAWYSKDYNNSMRACLKGIELSKEGALTQRNLNEVSHLYLSLAFSCEKQQKYSLGISTLEELLNRKLNHAFDSWTILKIGDLYACMGKKKEAAEKYNWVINNSTIEKHKDLVRDKLKELNNK